MLKLNAYLKEQNVRFSLKRNKVKGLYRMNLQIYLRMIYSIVYKIEVDLKLNKKLMFFVWI